MANNTSVNPDSLPSKAPIAKYQLPDPCDLRYWCMALKGQRLWFPLVIGILILAMHFLCFFVRTVASMAIMPW